MSVNYSEDPSYAASKLQDSIVKFEGFPFQVHSVAENGDVVGYKLGQKLQTCHLNDLDLSSIQLGYVNIHNWTTYLMRVPSRQWRQGIRTSNITSVGGSHQGIFGAFSTSFINLTRNIYPTPTDCLEMVVNGEVTGQAFSRNFAIVFSNRKKGPQVLLYKSLVVGTASMGAMRVSFELTPQYQYLSEALEEERNDRL